VFTQADRVESPADLAELRAALGDIDTPSEATLIAMTQGLMLNCAADSVFLEGAGTAVHAMEWGYRIESQWHKCGITQGKQAIDVYRDATTSELENMFTGSSCSVGRRPRGLELARVPSDGGALGRFLAQTAQLEAASVHAFERLDLDLQQLGAADALISAARRSASDERRHARLTGLLAQRYGGAVLAPNVPTSSVRPTAFAIAFENATEGCVRETFGALIAWHQAALARDPHVAAVMTGIAADETRHAELSWNIAEWLEPQLSASERAQIFAAREMALRELEHEIVEDPMPEPARELLGIPPASLQTTLLDRMSEQLGLS
jgi:hypothetical protein